MKINLNNQSYICEILDKPNTFSFTTESAVTRDLLDRSLSGFSIVDKGEVVFQTGPFIVEHFEKTSEGVFVSILPISDSSLKLRKLEAKVNILEMQVMMLNMNTEDPNLPPMPPLPEV